MPVSEICDGWEAVHLLAPDPANRINSSGSLLVGALCWDPSVRRLSTAPHEDSEHDVQPKVFVDTY